MPRSMTAMVTAGTGLAPLSPAGSQPHGGKSKCQQQIRSKLAPFEEPSQ
jgi:hypothetical protein